MISISIPSRFSSEIRWVLSHVFKERFGLAIAVKEEHSFGPYIISDGQKSLEIANDLFGRDYSAWPSASVMPMLPLQKWDSTEVGSLLPFSQRVVPVIFGQPGFTMNDSGRARLGLDVIGSAFFMLSRVEELIVPDRDEHDRFPAAASVAYKAGFLERPIVDEYIEILWAAISRVWPGLERKRAEPRTIVSCDVDNPYEEYVKSWRLTAKRVGGDILKRRSARIALQTITNAVASRMGNYRYDPLHTFEWIMDVNEKAGNKVAFYFKAGKTSERFDGHYCLEEPRVRALMRRMHDRGHEIGIHPSYNTYRDGALLRKEVDRLGRVMDEEGIKQDELGSRMHYLRWSTPETARHLEAAGVDYDTTLGYADRPGFRCGTCHEYRMFDPLERRQLKLRQRPLIVMECSLLSDQYKGLQHEMALMEMKKLKATCEGFGGSFNFLWHNSQLDSRADRESYKEMIA